MSPSLTALLILKHLTRSVQRTTQRAMQPYHPPTCILVANASS